MSWEAIGAIGQMLGSIAVFVTLGYLAVQVGHARREMQRSISQSRSEGIRDMFMTRLSNERLTALNLRVQRAMGGLPLEFATALIAQTGVTEDDAYTLHWEQAAWWQGEVQTARYLNELTDAERIAWERNVRRAYSGNRHSALWYEMMKDTLNPDTVHCIDSVLARRS